MNGDQWKPWLAGGKPRKKPGHPESELQRACVRWFRMQYPQHLLFHIPNGGKRNAREAAIFKAEGVVAGIPDLFLAEARHGHHGLFIEMKAGRRPAGTGPPRNRPMPCTGSPRPATCVRYATRSRHSKN